MEKVFNIESLNQIQKDIMDGVYNAATEEPAPKTEEETEEENKKQSAINPEEFGEVNVNKEKEIDAPEPLAHSGHTLFSRIRDIIKRHNVPISEIIKDFNFYNRADLERKMEKEMHANFKAGGTMEEYIQKISDKIEAANDYEGMSNLSYSEQPKIINDFVQTIDAIEDPDKKYQAQQVLIKLKTQGVGKIDLSQFDFEKDSAEKIQLTLQGQLKFGKENTIYYKDLSDKQIAKLRSIQLLQQKFPDKISLMDIVNVANAGEPKAMERAIIKIAQREGISEIPNIRITSEMINDSIQQKVSLDQVINDAKNQSQAQSKTHQSPTHQKQNNDQTR